jgi:hypothetical protein
MGMIMVGEWDMVMVGLSALLYSSIYYWLVVKLVNHNKKIISILKKLFKYS